MSQIARNLTDSEGGILIGNRYLIHDRDPLFTAEFLTTITRSFRIVPGESSVEASCARAFFSTPLAGEFVPQAQSAGHWPRT